MSDASIKDRAREFVARYPAYGLDECSVLSAWEKKPEAARVPIGTKAERLEQMARMLKPAGIGIEPLVRLAAGNPEILARPAQHFAERFVRDADALGKVGVKPAEVMDVLLTTPSFASIPSIKYLQPVSYLAQAMSRCGLEPDILGRALVEQREFLPLLSELGDTGALKLVKGLEQEKAPSGTSPQKAGLLQLVASPQSVVTRLFPHLAGASGGVDLKPKEACPPARSMLGITKQMAAFLAPYGVTHEQAAAATSGWPSAYTLTLQQAKNHVGEVSRCTGIKREDYVRALCADLPAGLKIMTTAKGEARRYFKHLSQKTGADRDEIGRLLLSRPSVAADFDKAADTLLQRRTAVSARPEKPVASIA